jgi:hypothetical protein
MHVIEISVQMKYRRYVINAYCSNEFKRCRSAS